MPGKRSGAFRSTQAERTRSKHLHLSGELTFRARRARLYELIMDPHEVAACVPGFREMKVESRASFTVFLKRRSGLLSGDFSLVFEVQETDPPNSARLLLKGTGRDSTVVASITVRFDDEVGNSVLRWEADADLNGRIASIEEETRTREIEGVIQQLFSRLRERITTGGFPLGNGKSYA